VAAPKNSAMLAVGCPDPALRVDLGGNPVRKGVLLSWLKVGYPDAAAQLETGQSGAIISLTLEAVEVRQFVSIMTLHGFVGREPSGLTLSVHSPSEAWMSALRAASYIVCLTL
jgi:hypothetical protein